MPQGKIKKIISDKGFGFIERDGNDKDLFFHCSALPEGIFESLTEGQAVEFSEGRGEKGPRAENVQVI